MQVNRILHKIQIKHYSVEEKDKLSKKKQFEPLVRVAYSIPTVLY